MRRFTHVATVAALLAGACIVVHAAEPTPPSVRVQPPPPPNAAPPSVRPPEDPPIPCDLRASPDYVAGIDARGKTVAPADVPSGQGVGINSEMFVDIRPQDRRLRGTGVIVNLPGLGAPACVPIEDNSRR